MSQTMSSGLKEKIDRIVFNVSDLDKYARVNEVLNGKPEGLISMAGDWSCGKLTVDLENQILVVSAVMTDIPTEYPVGVKGWPIRELLRDQVAAANAKAEGWGFLLDGGEFFYEDEGEVLFIRLKKNFPFSDLQNLSVDKAVEEILHFMLTCRTWRMRLLNKFLDRYFEQLKPWKSMTG
jgi:hypothetical protein